ncbi:MAG: glycogen/starch synthase [Candidatus Tectimicrobiota bacterium]
MATEKPVLRIAMLAWEIGRVSSGFGTKIGGMGAILEELPRALIEAAAGQDLDLHIEILSPCFAHYDRRQLRRLDVPSEATIGGVTFPFEVYSCTLEEGVTGIYFWDEGQLHWTHAQAIYPDDPWLGLGLYAALAQAMAGYLRTAAIETLHLHDYHVGLVPFYLGDAYLRQVPLHLTIHNATYQGITPLRPEGGFSSLDALNLPGAALFHRYFDFFDTLNPTKACMLKVHEMGGKITTVSGDLAGTWGYAAELRQSHAQVWARAAAQKHAPPGEVFVPNRHLDLFEKLPIAGITNGMSASNRPDQLPELRASVLQALQARRGPNAPLFRHALTQEAMLARDHTFDAQHLETKAELKRLLHLEAFGTEPVWDPILLTAVGRLVEQKNFGLVAAIVERTLAYDAGTKFVILASAAANDPLGQHTEAAFAALAERYPGRVAFNRAFNQPLSRLILAGGDFCLMPSRFEPCGLVDYEASLLGNVVIGRATGGLTKVRHCAYLYDWLDISDWEGEASAFFAQIVTAVVTYRQHPARHTELMHLAMALDTSWERSAGHYLDMYRYGQLSKRWQEQRRQLIQQFTQGLGTERLCFRQFFMPGQQEYGDRFDWQLRAALEGEVLP